MDYFTIDNHDMFSLDPTRPKDSYDRLGPWVEPEPYFSITSNRHNIKGIATARHKNRDHASIIDRLTAKHVLRQNKTSR